MGYLSKAKMCWHQTKTRFCVIWPKSNNQNQLFSDKKWFLWRDMTNCDTIVWYQSLQPHFLRQLFQLLLGPSVKFILLSYHSWNILPVILIIETADSSSLDIMYYQPTEVTSVKSTCCLEVTAKVVTVHCMEEWQNTLNMLRNNAIQLASQCAHTGSKRNITRFTKSGYMAGSLHCIVQMFLCLSSSCIPNSSGCISHCPHNILYICHIYGCPNLN